MLHKELSSELGGRSFYHVEVDETESEFLHCFCCRGMIGRKLDWKTDDLALQNIQARSRAPMVWLLANISGSPVTFSLS